MEMHPFRSKQVSMSSGCIVGNPSTTAANAACAEAMYEPKAWRAVRDCAGERIHAARDGHGTDPCRGDSPFCLSWARIPNLEIGSGG